VFWIVSDDPGWEGIQTLSASIPPEDCHVTGRNSNTTVNDSDIVLMEFHRMVMADALILSDSSFSVAAALLSAAKHIIVSPNAIRLEW